MTDNSFGKQLPCLTDKTLKDVRITLTENEKVVPGERELVKIFHEHFSNILSTLIIWHENFSNMIENSVYPDSLKQANIKPVYKKDSRNEKEI